MIKQLVQEQLLRTAVSPASILYFSNPGAGDSGGEILLMRAKKMLNLPEKIQHSKFTMICFYVPQSPLQTFPIFQILVRETSAETTMMSDCSIQLSKPV